MGTIEKMVGDDLIALKKTINYIFKQNATANRNLMYDVFLKHIARCITLKKPIQYNITFCLYATLPKIFRTNKYKEIVCYAVNKYFPNNEVILFEKFLIDNNAKEKYVSQIKDKYMPTDTTPQNYFLGQQFGMTSFWWDLHTKWVNTLYWNRKFSPKYRNDYLSMLIKKYPYILKNYNFKIMTKISY